MPNRPKMLIPRPRVQPSKRQRAERALTQPLFSQHPWIPAAGMLAAFVVAFFSLPSILAHDLKEETIAIETQPAFPVTVFPNEKEIVEDPAVEELLTARPTALTASAGLSGSIFTWLAVRVSELSVYRQVAGTAGIDSLFVTLYPGYRAEEVAAAFGAKLDWSPAERKAFLDASRELEPRLDDGIFVPGTYFVGVTDPVEVAAITRERFEDEVLARYGTSTEAQVPLEDALTIASLIEREAGGWNDMRLISGIIWNRLFAGMNLQLDATMQYAKATNAAGKGGWWAVPKPADKSIKSAYNTYRVNGLPPGPIANPSIASLLAALNPKKTDCLFYFHDRYGRFHCSPTYEGHVALLKKHYGQGR
jgi:UPF0755 protein